MLRKFLKDIPVALKKRGNPKYKCVDDDFDDEEFVCGIHPALESDCMDEVAAKYTTLTGKDFQWWLYDFMNDPNRRYTVYQFEGFLFDWITRMYLLASWETWRPATEIDARANKELLRSLFKQRVKWPLPYQGIMDPNESNSDIPINLLYCTLGNTASIEHAPWLEHPVAVRVSVVLDGVLYYGLVWEGSRKMEVAGIRI